MSESAFQLLNQHMNVSHETFDKLNRYYELLIKWQKKINLVGPDTISDAWRRHFLDSIQLLRWIDNLSQPIVDFGSGAGFPGMVLAIFGGKNIHLIESDAKKIAFMQEVSRITKSPVSLHHRRIEDVRIDNVGVITSRACSDLKSLCEYAHPLVSHGTICLFHKGKNYSKEIEDAKENWSFDITVSPSVASDEGVILNLSNLGERGRDYAKPNF